jgi:hypothetical protein
MDLVIAVVVFGFIAVTFYSLVTVQHRPSIDELQDRARTIETRLNSGGTSCGPIVDNQSITMEQIKCLYGKNATGLRQELGVSGNFCIYVENEKGEILIVQNETGAITTSIGDGALIIAGTPCGTTTP